MDHDHTQATHSAGCDAKGCDYVAKVHAHDDDSAASMLAQNLASHNKEVHGEDTDVEEITPAVSAKMKSLS